MTPEPSTNPPEAAARTTDSVDPSERESSAPDVPDFAHDQLRRGRERSTDRTEADYRRRSMEQRRNIEITVFGALVTGQIALTALAASSAGKPASHVISRFAAIVGITLFATYTAMIIAIEVRNRADRQAYQRWEVNRATKETLWESLRRSWAAWPILGAAVITAALVWTTSGLH